MSQRGSEEGQTEDKHDILPLNIHLTLNEGQQHVNE